MGYTQHRHGDVELRPAFRIERQQLHTTQFGPTPGALNLISGQTNGFAATKNVLDGSGNLLHPTHEAFGDASHDLNI
jgi:hypothetical protein